MSLFEDQGKCNSVDSSVDQLIHPTTESTAAAARMDPRTVEALRIFLQDMTVTIQSLVNRHDLVTQSRRIQAAGAQTSLSLALPSSSLKAPANRIDAPSSRSYGTGMRHACYQAAVTEQATSNQELKSFKREATICQDREFGAETQGVKSNLEMGNLTSRGVDEEEFASHQLNAETVDALRGFLEDMKKTIQAWSNRHRLIVQGQCTSPREDEEGTEIAPAASSFVSWPSSVLPLPSGGLSYIQSNNQNIAGSQVQPRPRYDGGNVSLVEPCQTDQHMLSKVLSEENGGGGALLHADGTHQADGVEPSQVEENVVSLPEPNQTAGCDEGKNSPKQINRKASAVVLSLSEVSNWDARVATQPTQFKLSEAQATEQTGHGNMTVEIPPLPNSRDMDGKLTPRPDQELKILKLADVVMQGSDNGKCSGSMSEVNVDGNGNAFAGVQLVMNRPYQREVQVVQSPDWLPKGWTTEVKIRVTGNSAGAKDKYYFDPVSKRRFRSKKEVFCFLETGKLGRYKPRSKTTVDVEKVAEGRSSLACQQNKCQPLSLSAGCTATTVSTSLVRPQSGSTSVSASEIFSNVFTPYRPGQPSDWLVYESLSSLPVPVFERFPFPEKDPTRSNGCRTPSHGPWFLSNSEKTWRHYPYKKGKRKAVDEGKNASDLQVSGGGLHASEAFEKHSASDIRDFCTKTSS